MCCAYFSSSPPLCCERRQNIRPVDRSSSDENHLKSTRLAFERWNESAPRSRILSSPYNRQDPSHETRRTPRRRTHARAPARASLPSNAAPPSARGAPRAAPPTIHRLLRKECILRPLRRLADSLAGVGQETLNQGDLRTANLALTAQALLVARAHVGVQVLLPRAPVQNLFRARIGKKKGGEARRSAAGSGRKGFPGHRGNREDSCERRFFRSRARLLSPVGEPCRDRRSRRVVCGLRECSLSPTSDEQTLNPIRRWLIRARRERARARDASLAGGRRRTFPLAVILNRLAADLLVLALP